MNTQRKLIAALSLCTAVAVPNIASAAAISGQGTWETTLQGRDLDGDLSTAEAYYDTVLDITWLADANYAMTSGYEADGMMTWSTATTWAANLNPYGSGISGWRLPTTVDVGNDGATFTNFYQGVDYSYNITTHSEMSHMFYVTLGNKAYYDTSGVGPQSGWGLTNAGPFSNVKAYNWSATEYAPNTILAWIFNTHGGYQSAALKADDYLYAWAVHDGDVGTPIPAVLDVKIDIKPGNKTNPVNPRSKGKLKVAVLTSETFDASTVDVSTIQFGPGSAAPVWYRLDDVDDDGDWDLVLKFNTQNTGIACGDTEASLMAKTFDGIEITGTDSVKTVGCKRQ